MTDTNSEHVAKLSYAGVELVNLPIKYPDAFAPGAIEVDPSDDSAWIGVQRGIGVGPRVMKLDTEGSQLLVVNVSGVRVYGISAISSVRAVVLDVKPGSVENTINPKSKGIIPIAILSTDSFDAATVDIASVRFGPNEALTTGRSQFKDLNRDGLLDLVLRFRTQDTGIQCGDTSVSIIGETVEGIPIQGSDTIRTVGCKEKHHKRNDADHHRRDDD